MTKRIVGWLVLLPFSALLIVFALANRQLVSVNLDPLAIGQSPAPAGFGVPLFIVVYLVLLVGVLLGGVATWFAQGRHRVEKRHLRREAERLHRDLDTARRAVGPTPVDTLTADELMTR